jgi:hypothetical protein
VIRVHLGAGAGRRDLPARPPSDPAGFSRNVCDGILRPDPYPDIFGDGGTVAVTLGPPHIGSYAATAVRLQPATSEVLPEAGASNVVVLPETT